MPTHGGLTDFVHVRKCRLAHRLFLVSNRLQSHLQSAMIHSEVLGSDHCPVEVDIEW